MEIWKDIKGYNGYQVSNLGNVKSFKQNKEKLLKPFTDKYGYLQAVLCKEGKPKTFTRHKLVALHFIPNPENKMSINHINGIKTDNRVENLEWNTILENTRHSIEIGLRSLTGENNPNSKLTNKEVINIRNLHKIGFTNKELAIDYGVSKSAMSKILRKETYTNI